MAKKIDPERISVCTTNNLALLSSELRVTPHTVSIDTVCSNQPGDKYLLSITRVIGDAKSRPSNRHRNTRLVHLTNIRKL